MQNKSVPKSNARLEQAGFSPLSFRARASARQPFPSRAKNTSAAKVNAKDSKSNRAGDTEVKKKPAKTNENEIVSSYTIFILIARQ